MANDLINLIPKDAEEAAAFIEAVRSLAGASKIAESVVAKFFGPTLAANWRYVSEKAKQFREKVSPDRHTQPTPALLIPLADAACLEDREELQDLWAALLANSMIDGGKKVRREYLDAAKRLEPVDVCVLKILRLPLPVEANANHPNAWHSFREDKRNEINLGLDEWSVSIRALTEIGFIAQGLIGNGAQLSPFARGFLAACEVQ